MQHVARRTFRNGRISITCWVCSSQKRNEKQSGRPFHKTHKLHKTQTAPPIINSSHPVIACIRREMSNGLTQPERRSEKRSLLKGTKFELYLSMYGYISLCSSVFWRFRVAGTDGLDLTIRRAVFAKMSSFFWDFTRRRFVVCNFWGRHPVVFCSNN